MTTTVDAPPRPLAAPAAASATEQPPIAPRWALELERAHDRLLRVQRVLESAAEPPLDLKPAADALTRALAALYDTYDERRDRLEAAQASMMAVNETKQSLKDGADDPTIAPAITLLDEAHKAIDASQEPLSRMFPKQPGPPPELVGSKEVPTLHAVDRPSLVPKLQVAAPPTPPEPPAPPLPEPKNLEDLKKTIEEVKRRAAARSKEFKEQNETRKKERNKKKEEEPIDERTGFVPKIPPAWSEDQFVASKTRELFEEVAMVGMQRTPLLGDPFRSCAFLERRLLCAMDAIMAFGPRGVAKIEPFVVDAPVRDSTRAFGGAFVFGCLEGRDALGAAERVLHFCGPKDDDVAKAWADAMKLVPHPNLQVLLRTMMQAPEPAVRAIAWDVLVYRHWATMDELVAALGDPSAKVVAHAIPELAILKYPYMDQVLDQAMNHADPVVKESAWTAMALSSHTWLVQTLEKELDGEMGDKAAQHLGVVCESRDAERLLEKAKAKPTEAMVFAVGWAGLGASIPWLIALLTNEKTKTRVREVAAYALDRMTGAQLYEPFEMDPEKTMIPDLPEPDMGDLGAKPKEKEKSLAAKVSDPRDLPGEGARDKMTRPTINAGRWRAYWEEKKGFYDPKHRYRRGHPYTPIVSLWEMADGFTVTPHERRLLQREMVVRTGDWVAFDPHDWVPMQEEALKQWEPIARRASGYPGSWNRSKRR
jgi:hypothetical protein